MLFLGAEAQIFRLRIRATRHITHLNKGAYHVILTRRELVAGAAWAAPVIAASPTIPSYAASVAADCLSPHTRRTASRYR